MDSKPGRDPLRLLPDIKRCRGYRLYAADGRRFLDLWQDDGRGILGAKGTGIGTVVKAETDKGLASPLPSIYGRRLEKALKLAFPSYGAARFYPDEAGACRALAAWAVSKGMAPADRLDAMAFDPAHRRAAPGRCVALLERPFPDGLDMEASRAAYSLALLRLPVPRAFSPVVLLFREETDARAFDGDPVPPLLLAAAVKALAELAGYRGTYNEEHWKRMDRRLSGLFERRGPRLYPRCAEADYPAMFEAALAEGVLLSPSWDLPSMVPGEFDDGELKGLSRTKE